MTGCHSLLVLAGLEVGCHSLRLEVGMLAGWLAGWLACWLLAGGLAGCWPAGWLAAGWLLSSATLEQNASRYILFCYLQHLKS